MKLKKLFHIRKSRKYPIKRDGRGLSLRARCFAQFDQGKRPAEAAQALKMNEATVFRYYRDWKRLGPDFAKQYSFVKGLLKKTAPDRERDIELFARMLGLPKEQFKDILSRPHGLRQFLTGKLYFPANADMDHKMHVSLELALLISDHVTKNGGKIEDVYLALDRWLPEAARHRRLDDAAIEKGK
jgi:hypothetical protein